MQIVIIEFLFIPKLLYLLQYLTQQIAPQPQLAQILETSNKQDPLTTANCLRCLGHQLIHHLGVAHGNSIEVDFPYSKIFKT